MPKFEKHDAKKAACIIRDAGGKIVGRTRLQKVAFLLEITGLGDGFDFEYRHYGPYSEQLANAISAAQAIGLVKEQECPAAWGGSYSIFTVAECSGPKVSRARRELIACVVTADPVALELAATAAFLAAGGEVDAWTETARRKPEKAASRLEEARAIYQNLQVLSTPKSLPSTSNKMASANKARKAHAG